MFFRGWEKFSDVQYHKPMGPTIFHHPKEKGGRKHPSKTFTAGDPNIFGEEGTRMRKLIFGGGYFKKRLEMKV